MKSFQKFITEAELRDKEGLGHGTGLSHRGGDKIGSDRKKTAPEKKRTKWVDGKKVAADYKPRKDIGTQRPKSTREQQPTQKRGSAALTPREQQRKAAMERRAAKSGGKSKAELEKAATKLLSKKKKTVDPSYKPRKASGLSPTERKALTRKGERTLRDITLKSTGKKKESELKHPITQKEITRRNKKK